MNEITVIADEALYSLVSEVYLSKLLAGQ